MNTIIEGGGGRIRYIFRAKVLFVVLILPINTLHAEYGSTASEHSALWVKLTQGTFLPLLLGSRLGGIVLPVRKFPPAKKNVFKKEDEF